METLLTLFNNFFSDLSQRPDQFRMLFVLLVAGAVLLFCFGLISLLRALTHPLRRRLRGVGEGHVGTAPVSALRDTGPAENSLQSLLLPKNEKEREQMGSKLVIAGYRSSAALPMFYMIKTVGAVVLAITTLLAVNAFPDLSTKQIFFYTIIAAFIGVATPNYVLNRKVERRQRQLRNGFPDALDLLIVCIEAGLGLNAAIQRVAREMRASYPDLAAELELVIVEIRAGVDRNEALNNLVRRTGLDDIRGLVSLLNQSLRLGTSVADTLRVYAEEFRDKRMQRAEEQAAKIGTKLIFPMVTCLFPSFFLVAMGPAVIQIARVFRQIGIAQ